MRLLHLLLLAASTSAFGASHYVCSSATGAGNGNNWTDAYTDLPDTLVRGDTYYMATGTYGQHTFTALAGTAYVYIRKATGADHGTDTGWQSSYGVGQAVWTYNDNATWWLRQSYLDVEGMTGSVTNGHGIKLVSTGVGDANGGVIQTTFGDTVSHMRFKHVEFAATGITPACLMYCMWTACSGDDWTFQNCYFHDCYIWMSIGQLSNVLVEYCYFKNAGSTDDHHCAGITWGGTTLTIRYSIFENMLGDGDYSSNTTYIEPQGAGASEFYCYGNVFWASDSRDYTTTATIFNDNVCMGMYIYNNTFYGIRGNSVGISGGHAGTSHPINVYNNIFQACMNQNRTLATISFENVDTLRSNILNNGSCSFVGVASGNFHLAAKTSVGYSLDSPFNSDMDGNIRGADGTWDVGAYEYAAGGSNSGNLIGNLRILGNSKFGQ